MCNGKLCKRFVGSVSVTVTGTSLVVNIPQANYDDCEKLCIAILQEIPTTATRGLPVVITIGTNATEYSLIRCNGTPVTQEYIAQGNIYRAIVQTTVTSAVFRVLGCLSAACVNLASIPVATTVPPAGGGE